MDHSIQAAELFLSGCNCAQAVLVAFCDVTGLEPEFAKRSPAALAAVWDGCGKSAVPSAAW